MEAVHYLAEDSPIAALLTGWGSLEIRSPCGEIVYFGAVQGFACLLQHPSAAQDIGLEHVGPAGTAPVAAPISFDPAQTALVVLAHTGSLQAHSVRTGSRCTGVH